MRYHVFIEGCRDATPGGVERLASALGQRYGMSPPAVIKRLQDGRFCARASLDQASARRLVAELETLGAHASMDGEGATRAAPRYESGLAAAFAGDRLLTMRMDLGALGIPAPEQQTDAGWELAHVDGSNDGQSSQELTYGPDLTPTAAQEWTRKKLLVPARTAKAPSPAPAHPAPAGYAAAAPPPVPPRASGSSPPEPRPVEAVEDRFAPADAGDPQLELADQPTRVLAAPREPEPARSIRVRGGSALRRQPVAIGMKQTLATSPRARFAAGVAVAFLLGLVPAQLYAWSNADSYEDIRSELVADYAAADSPARWTALASTRADAVTLAESRQRRVVISSCLIWLAVAGAIGFAWFRLVDWPRMAPSE